MEPKNKLLKGDYMIWVIFIMLCLLSLVECFSAMGTLSYGRAHPYQPIIRHAFFLFVGFGIVVAAQRLSYKYTLITAYFGLLLSIVLLIITPIIGVELNGGTRWLNIFGIQFQPSELAKITLVLYIAWTIGSAKNKDSEEALRIAFWKVLIATGVICLLIVTQNLSTAILVALTAYLMMLIGGLPKLHMRVLSASAAVIFLFAFLLLRLIPSVPGIDRWETWHNRLVTHEVDVLDPSYQKTDDNAQIHYAKIAIANGKFLGKFPGNSTQRDFLPQAYSDFIYAIIIEEMGWLGMLFTPLLYILLLFRCRRIARSCARPVPSLLVIGCSLIIAIQAFFNLAVAVGALPVTGQTLPLVSRGGTSVIITCLYFEVILRVSQFGIERQAQLAQMEMTDSITEADLQVQDILEKKTEEPTEEII